MNVYDFAIQRCQEANQKLKKNTQNETPPKTEDEPIKTDQDNLELIFQGYRIVQRLLYHVHPSGLLSSSDIELLKKCGIKTDRKFIESHLNDINKYFQKQLKIWLIYSQIKHNLRD